MNSFKDAPVSSSLIEGGRELAIIPWIFHVIQLRGPSSRIKRHTLYQINVTVSTLHANLLHASGSTLHQTADLRSYKSA